MRKTRHCSDRRQGAGSGKQKAEVSAFSAFRNQPSDFLFEIGVEELPADDVDTAYQRLYQALEGERFWVVFETDMGSRMEKMRERWGADYNRQQLIGVRSMVFCNIDWTHRIANADPQLLALCPLHLSVYGQNGSTTVVMPRPSVLAAGSAGIDEASALEAELTGIIQRALSKH